MVAHLFFQKQPIGHVVPLLLEEELPMPPLLEEEELAALQEPVVTSHFAPLPRIFTHSKSKVHFRHFPVHWLQIGVGFTHGGEHPEEELEEELEEEELGVGVP